MNVEQLLPVLIVQAVILLSQFLTLRSQNLNAIAERKLREKDIDLQIQEKKASRRRNYLNKQMEKLLKARIDYEVFMMHNEPTKSTESTENHGKIIGGAIAACLATNDAALIQIATSRLTPYFVEGDRWKTDNRKAIDDAVILLAEIIQNT